MSKQFILIYFLKWKCRQQIDDEFKKTKPFLVVANANLPDEK